MLRSADPGPWSWYFFSDRTRQFDDLISRTACQDQVFDIVALEEIGTATAADMGSFKEAQSPQFTFGSRCHANVSDDNQKDRQYDRPNNINVGLKQPKYELQLGSPQNERPKPYHSPDPSPSELLPKG
jgi:hypothetical protein